MTFCSWCTREYEPHESQATAPKRYCSQQCENEANEAKEAEEEAKE